MGETIKDVSEFSSLNTMGLIGLREFVDSSNGSSSVICKQNKLVKAGNRERLFSAERLGILCFSH